jgi:hypothetical protein
MRAVGLVFCLFAFMVLSNILSGGSKSVLVGGFSKNMLVALWLAFLAMWVGGILSWILWRISAVRIWIRGRYSADKLEDPAWERRMTITFSALLLSVVGGALFLAAMGYHAR